MNNSSNFIECYGVQHSEWGKKRNWFWTGQEVQIRAYISTYTINRKRRKQQTNEVYYETVTESKLALEMK